MSRWLAGFRRAYEAHPIPVVALMGLIALAVGFGIGAAIMMYAFPHVGTPASTVPVQFGTSQSAQSQAPVTSTGPGRPEPAPYTPPVPAPVEGPATVNAPGTSLRPVASATPIRTSPASVSPSPSGTVSVSASPAPSPSASPSPDPAPDPIGGSS
jgi:hypothetical protein